MKRKKIERREKIVEEKRARVKDRKSAVILSSKNI